MTPEHPALYMDIIVVIGGLKYSLLYAKIKLNYHEISDRWNRSDNNRDGILYIQIINVLS